jgi:glycosyltransferase involved in cell wall biosynthesis
MKLPLRDGRLRVLALATHPVQYAAPQFRRMAVSPDLDFQVVYCSLRGVNPTFDADFGKTVCWDVPLLDGYRWTTLLEEDSSKPTAQANPDRSLWRLIRRGNFDALLCYVGYLQRPFWIAYLAAKFSGTSFLFGTDATTLVPRDSRPWKKLLKRFAWPTLFRLADQVIVPSTGTFELMRNLGIHKDRITLTPYTVDNDWWVSHSRDVDRELVRTSWGASPQHKVILFCAKLQPWKRPLDLLHAFAKCNRADSLLVFAGDGPLRDELHREATSLRVASRVRFLGFVNQSALPAVYRSADLMVLPSEYEPFAVVVNEAMCCGCPAAVSDRVGAAKDLVIPVYPPFVFPCGNIEALADVLTQAIANDGLLNVLKNKSQAHMTTWSFNQNVPATIEAVERAVSRKTARSRVLPMENSATSEMSDFNQRQ